MIAKEANGERERKKQKERGWNIGLGGTWLQQEEDKPASETKKSQAERQGESRADIRKHTAGGRRLG